MRAAHPARHRPMMEAAIAVRSRGGVTGLVLAVRDAIDPPAVPVRRHHPGSSHEQPRMEAAGPERHGAATAQEAGTVRRPIVPPATREAFGQHRKAAVAGGGIDLERSIILERGGCRARAGRASRADDPLHAQPIGSETERPGGQRCHGSACDALDVHLRDAAPAAPQHGKIAVLPARARQIDLAGRACGNAERDRARKQQAERRADGRGREQPIRPHGMAPGTRRSAASARRSARRHGLPAASVGRAAR